ncbi:hypothetical protein GLOIN_2v1503082 [Rhizophagus irregularis DAOM 181602=DAOM 197198]|uniref:Uncharacterized protein n=1 Tax=Rhizophagus irregularis (strain DAOM 181602 / DAOM 197198 / MUCL 43194) TaxID=747089 RepID=A0A2P4QW14_RHIID|nr:hypothetical protein GLOIN_2v1503082 [Rhizophagus irregularis DAOM 181602=DAOM 197198]POG81850.1 hypothetical protein GLOIN_2v1503082 [Rhizophagus irregularis DAOM 181602=DAOM 197198]|eukprot:XP_025188716.1 hypothetical protein GLOIN_2v1503082 [Rhizophagus irregularis DAOM 181602=DAOM 197198]
MNKRIFIILAIFFALVTYVAAQGPADGAPADGKAPADGAPADGKAPADGAPADGKAGGAAPSASAKAAASSGNSLKSSGYSFAAIAVLGAIFA